MAYVDQEKKAKLKAALEMVMPDTWKWSLAVRNHSTICLTISKAPLNLLELCTQDYETRSTQYVTLNPYHYEKSCDPTVRGVITEIFQALNTDNFDHSDSQTDYFSVGHYVDVSIGRFGKPFQVG